METILSGFQRERKGLHTQCFVWLQAHVVYRRYFRHFSKCEVTGRPKNNEAQSDEAARRGRSVAIYFLSKSSIKHAGELNSRPTGAGIGCRCCQLGPWIPASLHSLRVICSETDVRRGGGMARRGEVISSRRPCVIRRHGGRPELG